MPYAYEDLKFVCEATSWERKSLNLGQLFGGDRIVKSQHSMLTSINRFSA